MKSKKTKTFKLTDSKSRDLYGRIRVIIENARNNVVRAVNSQMLTAYWHIGQEIVEEEQKGKSRAE